MSRINTVAWSDGCTITRMMGQLQDSLMKYQPYSLIDPETGRPGRGCPGGDSDVIVNAIYLRDRLNTLIERSCKANGRD